MKLIRQVKNYSMFKLDDVFLISILNERFVDRRTTSVIKVSHNLALLLNFMDKIDFIKQIDHEFLDYNQLEISTLQLYPNYKGK
jgi:hypothetical protein